MRRVHCPHCGGVIAVSVESRVAVSSVAAPQEPAAPLSTRVLGVLERAGVQGKTIRQLQHSIPHVSSKQMLETLYPLMEDETVEDEVCGRATYYRLKCNG